MNHKYITKFYSLVQDYLDFEIDLKYRLFIHNNRLTKFTILIQKALEGGYIGQCLEILAAISRGETLEEIKTNRKESMVLALELIKDLKKMQYLKNQKSIFKMSLRNHSWNNVVKILTKHYDFTNECS